MTFSTLTDMTGKRCGRLTVISRATPAGEKPVRWSAQCDCGGKAVVTGTKLRSGHTKSCGCLREEVRRKTPLTHGMSDSTVYRRWRGMLNRCRNPKFDAYKWYGARGIQVCERWLKFENFIADMGIPQEGMELDRIDTNLGYEPENCRWVSHQVNCQNRRSSRGARR